MRAFLVIFRDSQQCEVRNCPIFRAWLSFLSVATIQKEDFVGCTNGRERQQRAQRQAGERRELQVPERQTVHVRVAMAIRTGAARAAPALSLLAWPPIAGRLGVSSVRSRYSRSGRFLAGIGKLADIFDLGRRLQRIQL